MMALTGDGSESQAAREHLKGYLRGLVAAHRAQPQDDLLTELIRARDLDDRLSEEELVTFAITLLVAGHETTANQLGNSVYLLLANRELWESLVADPSLIPAAVEELLRYVPLSAGAGFARIAKEDLVLPSGHPVAAGDASCLTRSPPTTTNSSTNTPDRSTSTAPRTSTSRSATVPTTASAHRWPGWSCSWPSPAW